MIFVCLYEQKELNCGLSVSGWHRFRRTLRNFWSLRLGNHFWEHWQIMLRQFTHTSKLNIHFFFPSFMFVGFWARVCLFFLNYFQYWGNNEADGQIELWIVNCFAYQPDTCFMDNILYFFYLHSFAFLFPIYSYISGILFYFILNLYQS